MNPKYTPPSLLEIAQFLFKNKGKLFLIPFFVAVTVAIISLFITNRYTSTANLIPSQRPSLGLDLFSETGSLSSFASTVLSGGQSDEANRYVILLSSYSSSKQIVDRFNLTTHYEVSESKTPILHAIDILASRTTFESKEEGNFVISIEDKSPELAKEMADAYVQILNEENTRIVTGDAKRYREFLEKRLLESRNTIDSLQQEMISFQKKYGVIEFTEQAKQYFSLIIGLSAKQIETEIKLELLSQSVTESSDLYESTEIELNAINEKLNEVYFDSDSSNVILNFSEMPEVGSQYMELMLEAEIQSEIQKFVVPFYEQAKMEEAKALPIVSIVDAPRIPERKSFPNRTLITISSGFSAFFIVLFYLIFRLSLIKNNDFF
ncbi:MAG: hypothetical protein MI700_12260, partial [Balneolales bacterium]|nr:hypothetical protein [Balneolales bacterium]